VLNVEPIGLHFHILASLEGTAVMGITFLEDSGEVKELRGPKTED
jgi:hypothetical protein